MHPALQDAKSGIVRPAQPDSRVSAEEHNLGSVSGLSPFTSWTHDKQLHYGTRIATVQVGFCCVCLPAHLWRMSVGIGNNRKTFGMRTKFSCEALD